MSNSNKKCKKTERRSKRKQKARERRRRASAPVEARFVKPDIRREIRYITQRAQAGDSRIVTLGNLIVFSTVSRDAWLLDPEDNLAVRVCRDGEPQPVRIVDTPDTFAIEWAAQFSIDDSVFIIQERSGRIVAITGYPTAEIAAACRDWAARRNLQ